ncbi:putative bifunctional diguanylate cyclase/phosphodiesterase [Vibrio genomosp. F10 str. 9ZC157]|uniref:putative bifunctional diguanylate cyclase/phosphodiesterase n=1 Tax=Vibrio genomosp. F10 TaxID=723171 RepID=UPI0002FDB933|nr:bifunctional diguanylate cyclase/phosphodiesterase [Vibrio genomosp. F10]OEE98079.1 diguanylate cyclase [Vibrio genomosp. F10 str. 9ZC157]
MAMRLTNTGAIGLDEVNETLLMEGTALLDHVTLKLNQRFQSFSTSIVEFDKLRYQARTLSCVRNQSVQENFIYPLKNTPCEQIFREQVFSEPILRGQVHWKQSEYLFYTDNLITYYPLDGYIQENHLHAYIGIPLKNHKGETLGVLLSTFDRPIDGPESVLAYHQLFANIIVHSLREKWLAKRSKSLVNQLNYEVSHDNLTGLRNRCSLSDQLEVLIQSSPYSFTLAYVDIDNFKSINDLYGNYIGDQVLRFVASTISDNVPEQHLAFRISADEFAFITYDRDPIQVCHEIIHLLQQGYKDKAHYVSIPVSIGITRTQDKMFTADQLLHNASLALKDCKKTSGTQIRCYNSQLSGLYHRKNMIIRALRNELKKSKQQLSEIFVATQPIVHKHGDSWRYFEVLARWNSKQLGVISPIEFIEAAEQSGLIIELGERIIQLACEAKLELEKGLGHKVKLGINCSAHELSSSERYIQHLTSTLSAHECDPHDFVIELTETVLITHGDKVKSVLDRLRAFGFTIALDDFGTGYSSLNYLHQYPIDCIKIDASFVRNMLNNQKSERVVKLIIQLAEQLNVSLVAEGVETKEALDKLYLMGCKQIQGYYFSRPKTPIELIKDYFERANTIEKIKSA